MNINSKLVAFAQNELVIARNAAERDKINNSLSHLEGVLRSKLPGQIKEFIRFGSYTRNTILPRKYDSYSDVDLMIVFNTINGRLSPGTYRQKLKDAVTSSYPNSISRKDFPAVKLELNHIMFDLVPAYVEDSYWMNAKQCFIPGPNDQWRQTVPKDIDTPLTDLNQRVGNNSARNAIRLCKHWNASAGYPLESYLMEKDAILRYYGYTTNTYTIFLEMLSGVARNHSGAQQALQSIKNYQGDWWTEANPEKEWQWVRKLLPGLP